MRATVKFGIIAALLCCADDVWAIDWGECQQTEFSELQPDIVIPACSHIIDVGEADKPDLAIAHFRRGRGHEKAEDFERAVADYRLAAEQGYAEGQAKLGWMYENGSGVPLSFAEALKWYRMAAGQDNSLAQLRIGLFFAIGAGTARNYGEAAKWFRKAAEQGLPDAQYELGLLLKSGLGVSEDTDQAASWFRRASEGFQREAAKGDQGAQYLLGLMYADGDGVNQDYKEAGIWLKKAARQGHLEAANKLFLMHAFIPQFRLGPFQLAKVKRQIDEGERRAAEELERKSALGSPVAKTTLGLHYLDGNGDQKDQQKGIDLIKEAAQENYATALEIMSELYFGSMGDLAEFGVPKDNVQSLKWAILAVEQGVQRAKSRIDYAPNYMSPGQIAEAERLAREWKERRERKPG